MAFLPESTNGNYRGSLISAWFVVLSGIMMVIPGCIHYFLPDGGAGVIAHIDLTTRASSIIAIFAWYGAMQIPFGVTQIVVGLRYRTLVPFFLLMIIVHQGLSAYSAWFWKGSFGDHHPPEHYASAVTLVLSVLFLLLSWRSSRRAI